MMEAKKGGEGVKKSSVIWLLIAANAMMVTAAILGACSKNSFGKTGFVFIASFFLSILSVLFVFEIRSVCFGTMRPKLGMKIRFLRAYYENTDHDYTEYVRILKRILSVLMITDSILLVIGIVGVTAHALLHAFA